jgi:hypothetical protein
MGLEDLAARLAAAGDRLAGTGAALAACDPGARAFGADAPGHLGELGRALHDRCASALAARARESAAHAARLADLAAEVRAAATGYADAEVRAAATGYADAEARAAATGYADAEHRAQRSHRDVS